MDALHPALCTLCDADRFRTATAIGLVDADEQLPLVRVPRPGGGADLHPGIGCNTVTRDGRLVIRSAGQLERQGGDEDLCTVCTGWLPEHLGEVFDEDNTQVLDWLARAHRATELLNEDLAWAGTATARAEVYQQLIVQVGQVKALLAEYPDITQLDVAEVTERAVEDAHYELTDLDGVMDRDPTLPAAVEALTSSFGYDDKDRKQLLRRRMLADTDPYPAPASTLVWVRVLPRRGEDVTALDARTEHALRALGLGAQLHGPVQVGQTTRVLMRGALDTGILKAGDPVAFDAGYTAETVKLALTADRGSMPLPDWVASVHTARIPVPA